MAPSPYIFGNFDVAELVLILFFAFFLGLVFYLRREDRREGYPLEDDAGRREPIGSFIFYPSPKIFLLPHGHGTRTYPDYNARDTRKIAARYSAPMEGSPIEPTGDASADGVGPGAYADRPHYPDLNIDGLPRIIPLRASNHEYLAKQDADPRGMQVIGADGKVAGVVNEVWFDRSEFIVRYLEIEVGGPGGRRILAPMNMSVINGARRIVEIKAIRADQFAGVPAIESDSQVTLYEEDRIAGYFGGGYLYATPDRQEPWI
jgi:photosynthetic reaction center H subunit